MVPGPIIKESLWGVNAEMQNFSQQGANKASFFLSSLLYLPETSNLLNDLVYEKKKKPHRFGKEIAIFLGLAITMPVNSTSSHPKK